MDLSKYNLKRDFNSTTEPRGVIKKSKNELIFVIQKHATSNLHYDFRMEMSGVLRSWTIPNGPSMNPEEKRLAIMVENHPYAYKDFEGTIPEGNYGAGNIIIWDSGTYSLRNEQSIEAIENKFKSDLQDGQFNFILSGKKLNGEFVLKRMKIKQKNAWLLMKKEDQYASKTNVLNDNKSVVSNLTLEEIVK